ncbi:Uncharacterised protein [Fusobacterium polymorphum]|uniref:Uncharacterized protein n=2 Tax=Fusobacterium TaxID=848 RepID=A5TXH1_FUSNP|nr:MULTISPECIES: hypothetical protein [Fusobacterium]EDK89596.1 hypothetical protein FNP_1824 [Fusobacterium polymorphum ATCC 10953]ERT49180.1 hypothetical protein HMPREF1767_00319 [Fusobacterium nucleatum CTI-6]UTI52490.1 hypothetical protein NLJ26_08740 [Fusobacterium polymorphum]WRL69227.1 hypothetical protein VKN78_03840 [Fusobacterium polymorphum]CKH05801.1 Uncharacterised protein [Fusobacterium polymorphum]
MKFSLYIGTNKYSLSTEDDILKLSPDNFECQYKILIGNIDILKSVQLAYRKLFKKSIDKFNKNNPKKEIKSYYCKINESLKQSLAVGILIKINEKNYKNLDEEKIIELFLNQVKVIKKLLKNFYIVSAALYFEKSLTLRIIGIPYIKDKSNELEIRVSKSSCFTREKVKELRLSLQIQANKDFLKFFVTKTKVIVTKNNIDIKQLKLFENYRENRV